MLDAYSESRRKLATWKVMFEMGEMLRVGFCRMIRRVTPAHRNR